MTKRQVERAAKKGPLAALNNSIEKWTQIRDAPAKELRKKLLLNWDYFGGRYCACCVRVNQLTGAWCHAMCPLTMPCGLYSCDGYRQCEDAIKLFLKNNPIAPVRQAIRELVRNMKKARKILLEQLK